MKLFNSLLLLALAMPVAAQEREIRSANLPADLEREVLRMYEGGAARYDGPATIERTQVVRGHVAALGGPLTVAGQVTGDLVMVGGDVIIEPDGVVMGRITVIGGEVRLGEGAEVGGSITAYGTPTPTGEGDLGQGGDRKADGERGDDEEEDDWWDRRRRDRDRERGSSRLTIRTGTSYNRVEGLPVMFGPVIRTARPNPLRLEALAIWRSQSGASLDTDRLGYQVKAEQFLGGGRGLRVGGSLFSVVDALDRWQISDLEASVAAALFHDDYRDYYDRTGWSAFVGAEPLRGLDARLEYRQEEHRALPAGDPWSLFHGDDLWRDQPLVAEGEIRLLGGSLELDRRDDRDDPVSGWYARLAVETTVGGALTRPALLVVGPENAPTTETAVPATEFQTDFTSGHLDLRRYALVGHESQLNMRVVAGGSLMGKALPPQFQHALGGVGTLPGFSTFQGDCGARTTLGSRDGDRFFPAYGCDRFALAQVEYRGDLSLDFGFGEPDYDEDGDWWDPIDIDLSPTWVVFMDAGQGWAFDDPTRGGDRDTGLLFDAGLGFLIDKLGIYAALPLNGDVEQEPRFFLRWGRRF